MKLITVFTPTYNRAYCLHQCYDSLVNQTNKNFIWLIVDDGSSDGTDKLVAKWREEGKIEIEYVYQKNQGMHAGHNTAYSLITTELNVCVDSDDYMPENAIEKITNFWQKNKNVKNIAGIIGLDAYKNGTIIGTKFPNNIETATLEDLYHKHNVSGDKKMVLKTEIVKQYDPYPIFENERFVPLGILYLLIGKDYKMLCLNDPLCIVEYMEDGSSRNIVKQYFKHPNGFRHARIINMKFSNYLKVKFKNAVHYVAHSIQLKDFKFLNKTPKIGLTILAIPFGILMYGYIIYFNKLKK